MDQHHLYISSSIGVSLIDPGIDNANVFIKEADIAMYEVKAKGRDGVYVFDQEMSARVENRLEIERLLHFALKKNEISLHFQPQLNANREIIGAEALARWNNDARGFISPVDFIPVAEQTGLIIELGEYIIKDAFKTLSDWHKQGLELSQLSINISMRQFFHHQFIDNIIQLAKRYLTSDLQHIIIFELTETIVAEDIDKVISIIESLSSHGFRFSMDDFGTGYSSLSYLHKLPINELKIDRSFINNLEDPSHHDDSQSMITTILNMAKNFKLNIVAEGVETEYQFDFLSQYNCDLFQGYYFSRPVSKQDFFNYYMGNQ